MMSYKCLHKYACVSTFAYNFEPQNTYTYTWPILSAAFVEKRSHFSCFSIYTAIGYRNIPNTYTAPAHGDEKIHVNTPRRPRRRWPGSTFAKAMDKPRARPSRQTVHRPSTHRSQRRDRTAGKLTGKLWRIVHGSSTVHLSPSRHVDANRRSPVEDGRAARRIPKQEPRCLGECTLLRHARSSHDDAHHGCSPYGDAHNSARWRGGGSTISDNRAWREGPMLAEGALQGDRRSLPRCVGRMLHRCLPLPLGCIGSVPGDLSSVFRGDNRRQCRDCTQGLSDAIQAVRESSMGAGWPGACRRHGCPRRRRRRARHSGRMSSGRCTCRRGG